jgi:universal stress protein F
MMTIRKVLVATAAFAGLSVAAGAAGAGCNINTIMAVGHPDLAQYLLGPNAARVVRHATCSVLVVR